MSCLCKASWEIAPFWTWTEGEAPDRPIPIQDSNLCPDWLNTQASLSVHALSGSKPSVHIYLQDKSKFCENVKTVQATLHFVHKKKTMQHLK